MRFQQPGNNNPVTPRDLLRRLNKDIVKKDIYGRFDYIPVSDVVSLLNHCYHDQWNFEIVGAWEENILDLDKLVHVHGRMTITGIGVREQISTVSFREHCVTKSGKTKSMSALLPEDVIATNFDMLFKSAVSDCMKKLASYFHIADELYGGPSVELFESDEITEVQDSKLKKMQEHFGSDTFATLVTDWEKANGKLDRLNFIKFSNHVKEIARREERTEDTST